MNEDLQLALDYLDNRLSQEERLAFEIRLSSEPEMHVILEEIEKSKKLSGHIIELETRNVLNSLEKSTSTQVWLRWLVAASVILLVCYLYYLQDKTGIGASQEELFALMVEPAPQELRSDSMQDGAFSEARQLYQNKQYSLAISRLENLPLDSSNIIQYQRYLAHSYLRMEKWGKSDSLFIILSKNSAQVISIEAIYHRCIIAIALHDKTKATELYQLIQTSSQISDSKKNALAILMKKI